MEKIYMISQNEVLPIEEADICVGNRNIFSLFKKIVSGETMERGFSPFEVMEARGSVCFKLAEHLERLFYSVKFCRIKIPYSIDELSLFIAKALESAGLKESILRLDVILGEEGAAEPLIFLIKIRLKKEKKPLALKTFEFSRIMPNLKVSGGYVYAQIEKRSSPDYDDILYFTPKQYGHFFTETSRGNFFAIFWSGISNKYYVHGAKSSSILQGITYRTLLKIDSISDKFIFTNNGIHLDGLKFIKEAFITSSSNRIIPIRKIDEHFLDIGTDGKGGPITSRLSELFDAYVDDYYQQKIKL
ncbi:MAG: aminotransferase class IV [Candidatus Niyogibacteria bacterium]|nr:aminotransferase class IV [Candidatus Niyogibacteria bacterium]